MNSQPNSVKLPCPLCGGNLEVSAESIGQIAPCPHCGEEIPLEKPAKEDFAIKSSGMAQYHQARNRSASDAATKPAPLSKDMEGNVLVSIILAVLIPFAGFFCGIYLMTKKTIGLRAFLHGLKHRVVFCAAAIPLTFTRRFGT